MLTGAVQPWGTWGRRVWAARFDSAADSEAADLRVILTDGTEVSSSSASISTGDDTVVCRSIFDQVIDLEKVAKVTLNGEELPLP